MLARANARRFHLFGENVLQREAECGSQSTDQPWNVEGELGDCGQQHSSDDGDEWRVHLKRGRAARHAGFVLWQLRSHSWEAGLLGENLQINMVTAITFILRLECRARGSRRKEWTHAQSQAGGNYLSLHSRTCLHGGNSHEKELMKVILCSEPKKKSKQLMSRSLVSNMQKYT